MHLRMPLLLIVFLAAFCSADAQQLLSEGVITYKLTMANPQAPGEKTTGTYTIYIKGNLVRKDLSLSNGFRSTIIINGSNNTAVSLQSKNGRNLALQLDFASLLEKKRKYLGYRVQEGQPAATFASCDGNSYHVTYKDGTTTTVVLCDKWTLEADAFDRLPGVRQVPLTFELINDNGSVMYFQATEIQSKPIESSTFRIPSDYTLISASEYKEISR
ncbi:MAG: hypothetical protein EOO04_22095 [Chitinophagaceae bacterium]|nr:MAG: hypothetical protein EOO04_22095 [Chitinophagaceae bacterium]